MKIRFGYVSNSSSSSYVIKRFNKDLIVKLISSFIETIDFNSEDAIGITKDSILRVFENKLKTNDKDELDTYVSNQFYNLFDSYIQYEIELRNYELSNCKNCEFYNTDFKENKKDSKCYNCYCFYLHKNLNRSLNEIEYFKNDLNEFDFTNDFIDIKQFVEKLPIKTIDKGDRKSIDYHYCDYSDFLMKKVNHYCELWKKEYQNAFALSFASDRGDETEAFLRYIINDFSKFMQNNHIEGFRGENS